mmetsp:Transcript_42499/g.127389  ORF Transcript_42499/g.127389 Transcript_42499/m.127389 type:complete len:231 (-) Transcript_42499:477-1169(-)
MWQPCLGLTVASACQTACSCGRDLAINSASCLGCGCGLSAARQRPCCGAIHAIARPSDRSLSVAAKAPQQRCCRRTTVSARRPIRSRSCRRCAAIPTLRCRHAAVTACSPSRSRRLSPATQQPRGGSGVATACRHGRCLSLATQQPRRTHGVATVVATAVAAHSIGVEGAQLTSRRLRAFAPNLCQLLPLSCLQSHVDVLTHHQHIQLPLFVKCVEARPRSLVLFVVLRP